MRDIIEKITIRGHKMLKFTLILCTLLAFLVLIPVNALASSGQSVGGVAKGVDGSVLASVTITIDSLPAVPALTAGDRAKASEILNMGNKLYSSELLRGRTVVMSVFLKANSFGENNEIAGTIYVKNLYESNQEIVGYSPLVSTP